jgi:hypothetical protein
MSIRPAILSKLFFVASILAVAAMRQYSAACILNVAAGLSESEM